LSMAVKRSTAPGTSPLPATRTGCPIRTVRLWFATPGRTRATLDARPCACWSKGFALDLSPIFAKDCPWPLRPTCTLIIGDRFLENGAGRPPGPAYFSTISAIGDIERSAAKPVGAGPFWATGGGKPRPSPTRRPPGGLKLNVWRRDGNARGRRHVWLFGTVGVGTGNGSTPLCAGCCCSREAGEVEEAANAKLIVRPAHMCGPFEKAAVTGTIATITCSDPRAADALAARANKCTRPPAPQSNAIPSGVPP